MKLCLLLSISSAFIAPAWRTNRRPTQARAHWATLLIFKLPLSELPEKQITRDLSSMRGSVLGGVGDCLRISQSAGSCRKKRFKDRQFSWQGLSPRSGCSFSKPRINSVHFQIFFILFLLGKSFLKEYKNCLMFLSVFISQPWHRSWIHVSSGLRSRADFKLGFSLSLNHGCKIQDIWFWLWIHF